MRPKVQVTDTSVGGASAWIPVDWKQNPFSVGFYVDVQGTGTYKVQHGFTDFFKKGCLITRTTTSANLKSALHGLQVGDSVVVEGAGAPLDGIFAVASVVDANNVTYTVANSGAATSDPAARVMFIRVADHSTVTAKTTSSDGNYAFPVQMVRLNVTTPGVGNYAFHVAQGNN
jgi:hypothetical protein